jgi:rare lipoprotein A
VIRYPQNENYFCAAYSLYSTIIFLRNCRHFTSASKIMLQGTPHTMQPSIYDPGRFQRAVPFASALLALGFLAGCHHKQAEVYAPPPPEIQQELPTPPPATASPLQPAPLESEPPKGHKGKVIYSEVGLASWYGEPYRHSHAANGQVYHQDAMTAANKMLPMGSIVRVTNLATHQSVVVTITDRGPFVPGRMIDLSRGAAKRTGVYRMGIARVRMDVLKAPKPIFTGGHWIIQIGAFRSRGRAVAMRNHLERTYPTAYVIEFAGNSDYWVRMRPQGEQRGTAERIVRTLKTDEAVAYLVRVD